MIKINFIRSNTKPFRDLYHSFLNTRHYQATSRPDDVLMSSRTTTLPVMRPHQQHMYWRKQFFNIYTQYYDIGNSWHCNRLVYNTRSGNTSWASKQKANCLCMNLCKTWKSVHLNKSDYFIKPNLLFSSARHHLIHSLVQSIMQSRCVKILDVCVYKMQIKGFSDKLSHQNI